MDENKLNANPTVHRRADSLVDAELAKVLIELASDDDKRDIGREGDDDRDPFDAQEIFQLIPYIHRWFRFMFKSNN